MKIKIQDLENKELQKEILEMEMKIKRLEYAMKLKSFQDLGLDPASISEISYK